MGQQALKGTHRRSSGIVRTVALVGGFGVGVLAGCTATSSTSSPSVAPGGSTSALAAPTVGLSSPGPTPPAQPTQSAVSSEPPVGAAPVPGAWSTLAVVALSQPRPSNGTVVEWKGGDLAIAPDASDGPERLFSSTNGQSWTELPASTLGFDDSTGNTLLNGATACGDGVLVETVDGDGHVWLWWSTDLSSWTKAPFHNEGYATLAAIGSTAVANVDTGGGAPSGTAMDVSTDCHSWRRVALPGPKVAQITGLAANSSGFVAVGASGNVGDPDSKLLAWWSSDGLSWSAASTPSTRGERFITVDAGSDGLVALESTNDATPGRESLLASADGRAWKSFSGDPLGTITSGEGVGSPAGSITSDGLHLLLYGRKGISPADDSAGTAQYWLSTDGIHWSRPVIGGPDAPALLADEFPVPMVLPDGILFAGQDATWLGTP
jgi:hypothetical protein